MGPKKKEKLLIEENKCQIDQVEADHESFLQAFEKPTQIYRYLRTRHLVLPAYLHRNLSYMQERSERKKNTRDGFQIDSILKRVEKKHSSEGNLMECHSGMNINITGLFDDGLKESPSTELAELEAFLTKACNQRRKLHPKDITSSSVSEVCLGKAKIPVNPEPKLKVEPVSLPVEGSYFQSSNGNPGQDYTLHMRVRCTCSKPSKNNNQEHDDSPTMPPKRRKSRAHAEDSSNDVPPNSESSSHQEMSSENEEKLYGAELVVFDKNCTNLLSDGDYELILADLNQASSPPHNPSSWHTIKSGKAIDHCTVFHTCPTLKFHLSWHSSNDQLQHHHTGPQKMQDSNQMTTPSTYHITQGNKPRIFYQFMFSNNSRQQTEARDDLTCPWCLLNCMQMFSLLKHLRICHARFLFTYSEHPKGARIDVVINDHYDGSYSGNPQDLYSYMGYSFSREGPIQRMPVTHLIVCKPKKLVQDLAEFCDLECEDHTKGSLIEGYDRLYFHTLACNIKWPCELDNDSDSENDPEWLRQKTKNLIDDFTDVNEGEKEIMKMWNLHIMHYNIIGDCQLPRACSDFVQQYGPEIIRQSLTKNFMIHLVNMYDFGIIKPELINRTMMQLYRLQYKMHQDGLLGNTPWIAGAIEKAASVHGRRMRDREDFLDTRKCDDEVAACSSMAARLESS